MYIHKGKDVYTRKQEQLDVKIGMTGRQGGNDWAARRERLSGKVGMTGHVRGSSTSRGLEVVVPKAWKYGSTHVEV